MRSRLFGMWGMNEQDIRREARGRVCVGVAKAIWQYPSSKLDDRSKDAN
jgi:hypothetical protein